MKTIQSKKCNKVPGGKADEKDVEDFDKEQVDKGIKVEMEHTDDEKLSKEIAMDHLMEDDHYYDHLEKMEKEFEKDSFSAFSLTKTAKKKDLNPWAVCHTTVDKDEEPDKYERCVKKVKNKQSMNLFNIYKQTKRTT